MSAVIDVHHHMFAPALVAALSRAGVDAVGGEALPPWSPEQSLEVMDRYGIDVAMLSTPVPLQFADATQRGDVARDQRVRSRAQPPLAHAIRILPDEPRIRVGCTMTSRCRAIPRSSVRAMRSARQTPRAFSAVSTARLPVHGTPDSDKAPSNAGSRTLREG